MRAAYTGFPLASATVNSTEQGPAAPSTTLTLSGCCVDCARSPVCGPVAISIAIHSKPHVNLFLFGISSNVQTHKADRKPIHYSRNLKHETCNCIFLPSLTQPQRNPIGQLGRRDPVRRSF